jgi:hypothetical protein
VPTLAPRLLLAALVLALAGSLVPAVRADEPAASPPAQPSDAASPLARLRAEEQEAVRRKIPGVDALPREKQEQIARNVEWLRSLDPERRGLVLRRLHEAHDARLGGQKLDERMGRWRDLDSRQPQALLQGLVIRGLGRVAWRDLPPGLRNDPRVKALGERSFAVAFHRRFWGRAFKGLDGEAARAYEAPATVPQELRDRLTRLRAQVEGGDEKPLGRLREAVLQARAFEAVRTGAPPPAGPAVPHGAAPARDGDVRLAALGERIRDLARPAYDETLADFVAKWREKGADAWVAMVKEITQPPALSPEVRRKLEAVQVVFTVESWSGFLAQHPALHASADAILRVALVEELGMSAEEFATLPPRGDLAAQEQRAAALKQWLEQRAPLPREWLREALRRRFPPGGGERAGLAPGRPRPPGERPGQGGRRAPGAPGDPK